MTITQFLLKILDGIVALTMIGILVFAALYIFGFIAILLGIIG